MRQKIMLIITIVCGLLLAAATALTATAPQVLEYLAKLVWSGC